MTDNETRSLAVEKIVSAFRAKAGEVIVLEGCDHVGWCEAYRQNGIQKVSHATFDKLDQMSKPTDGTLRIVHVTHGLPATSLSEAEHSVLRITELADVVVFTPVSVLSQDVQDLLIAWPSFWAILFLAEGFVLRDIVRPAVWSSHYDDWETLQGTVVFTSAEMADTQGDEGGIGGSPVIDYVHPTIHELTLKRLLALQTSAMLTVNPGQSLSEDSAETQGLSSNIYIALPKRYSKKSYETKLFQEHRKWWQVALTTPWRASYWGDLWRLQRRTRRRTKSI